MSDQEVQWLNHLRAGLYQLKGANKLYDLEAVQALKTELFSLPGSRRVTFDQLLADNRGVSREYAHRIRGSARAAVKDGVSDQSALRTRSDRLAERCSLPKGNAWIMFQEAYLDAGGKL